MTVTTRKQTTEQLAAKFPPVEANTDQAAQRNSTAVGTSQGKQVVGKTTKPVKQPVKQTDTPPTIKPVAQADGAPSSKTGQPGDEGNEQAGAAELLSALERRKGEQHEPTNIKEDRA